MSQMYKVLIEIESNTNCFTFEVHNLQKQETYAFDSPEAYYESISTFISSNNRLGNYIFKDIPYKKYLEYKKIIKKVSSDRNLYTEFKTKTFKSLVEKDFPELLI